MAISTKRRPGPNVVKIEHLIRMHDLEKATKDKPWKLEVTTTNGYSFFFRFADMEAANTRATKIIDLGYVLQIETSKEHGHPRATYWPLHQIERLEIYRQEISA